MKMRYLFSQKLTNYYILGNSGGKQEGAVINNDSAADFADQVSNSVSLIEHVLLRTTE